VGPTCQPARERRERWSGPAVAVGPEVGVVGLLRGKKKRGWVGCWAGKKERRFGFYLFSFLFQPFTHNLFKFSKLF
jgi:hypothetical protein